MTHLRVRRARTDDLSASEVDAIRAILWAAFDDPAEPEEGFTEHELGRRTEVYGNLATVWSSYDGRTDSGSFHERGINSFQLVKVDGKWLIASILWQEESPEFPLPADMTKGTGK